MKKRKGPPVRKQLTMQDERDMLFVTAMEESAEEMQLCTYCGGVIRGIGSYPTVVM